RFLRTPGVYPKPKTAPRRGVGHSSHASSVRMLIAYPFQGYAKNAYPWLSSWHRFAVLNFVLCFLSFSYAALAFSGSELADAAVRKDAQRVRTWKKRNAGANVPQPGGAAACHGAARWDDVAIAAALLRAGANPQAVNRDGATPMFLATLNGSAAMIDTLLK